MELAKCYCFDLQLFNNFMLDVNMKDSLPWSNFHVSPKKFKKFKLFPSFPGSLIPYDCYLQVATTKAKTACSFGYHLLILLQNRGLRSSLPELMYSHPFSKLPIFVMAVLASAQQW